MIINSKHPFISVIIPVYKTEKYIENTAQSLVNQTFKNFEVILVDDETPDNAIKIAENVFIENSIKYITIFQKNSGLGISKNNGVKHAKGEWLLFLDSDDTLQPETFERMLDVISNNKGLNFIFTDFQRVLVGEEFKKAQIDGGDLFFNRFEIQDSYLLRTQIILSPGTLYNLDWFCNNDFSFKKIPYSMDQLFIWEMLLKVEKIVKIQKPLYNYLQRPGSIMSGSKFSSIIKGYPEFEKIQNKYLESKETTVLTKRYLLSRWVIGVLHSGARLTNYVEYKKLLKILESKKHSKNMLGFPSLSLKFVALILFLFPSVTYWIFRKI